MYLNFSYIFIILISIFHFQFTLSSICSQYYSFQSQYYQCECEDILHYDQSSVSLKCNSYSMIPNLISNINYHKIELESCTNDLNLNDQSFHNLTIQMLRIRHCNLVNLNERTFSNIKQLEKFYLENSTIKLFNGNFQDIFSSNSFYFLKSLTLKKIHYYQRYQNKKKLNFELLLKQLPYLYRLELINIYIDDYRYVDINVLGQHLTYLNLVNTHQNTLIPIEYLPLLERLLLRYLPNIFRTQPLISSLKKLKYLKYILFEHNQIKTIENLQSNTIDDIDLSSNLIETIHPYTFEYVPKLRQLILTGNPLNYIDQNAFCGIKNFQRLSIRIKHRRISPLDNCLLIHYPHLHIIQTSQTKLQCNCQLMNIFHLKRQENILVNRVLKLNQICLYNDTRTFKQQENLIHLYELENHLNCSSFHPCEPICQSRQRKMSLSAVTTILPYTQVKPKHTSLSLSISLYSFSTNQLLLLLLAFFVFVNM